MSSYIRRVQKSIAKSMGYRRETNPKSPIFGKIHNDGLVHGNHWPQVSAPTKETV